MSINHSINTRKISPVFTKRLLRSVFINYVLFSLFSVGIASAEESAVDVTSSEYNSAVSMLYQWWGVFEAPNGTDLSKRFDPLFADDVQLKIGTMEISGLEKLKEVYNSLPDRALAHHDAEIKVSSKDQTHLVIEADFIYQAKPAGEASTTGKTHYKHTLLKQDDGSLIFTELTGHIVEPMAAQEFASSYRENRARTAIIQYLAITDVLDSDYAGLASVMSDQTEIIGMFDPEKASYNDRGDGVLRGLQEIPNWLSSRKSTFTQVAHRLETIEVKALGDNLYEATVGIATQAWPKAGERISVIVPVKISLAETGMRYMQIKKILR